MAARVADRVSARPYRVTDIDGLGASGRSESTAGRVGVFVANSPRSDAAHHGGASCVGAARAAARQMTPLVLRPTAKINLVLRVGSTRTDGFHDLHTIFQSIALSDTMTLTRTRR